MNEQLSATIIPFPVRTREVPIAPQTIVDAGLSTGNRVPPHVESPELPHSFASSAQRLTYALNGLSNALADQRDATQRWKSALEDLASKMRTLGDVGKFRTSTAAGGSAELGSREVAEHAVRQP